MNALTRLVLLTLSIGPFQVYASERMRPEPLELYERKGDEIVDAPKSDLALARTYRSWKYKGEVSRGIRSTIMTRKRRYKVGEPVRVIHVVESVQKGIEIYLMGPEPVCEEYVDGKLVDNKRCYGSRSIGGGVSFNPIANFNYDISTYRFDKPGEHTIRWKAYLSESNLIKLYVEPK